MTAVRFERRGNQYTVRFVYSRDVVELIKVCVPPYARSWDPQRREWSVDVIHAEPLASTLLSFGHAVIGLDQPRRHHDDDPADWAKMLFRRIGPGRAGPIYRALSRCLHPDVGGDTQLQREINDAYRELSVGDDRKKSA